MAEFYKVIVSVKAEKDLQDILVYLEEEVGYQTAESIKDEFIEKLNSLESNPSKNSLFRADQFISKLYRRIVVKKAWNLIFQVEEKMREVYVLRILHVKRGRKSINEAFKE